MTTEELVQQMLSRKDFPPPPRISSDPMEKMKAGMGAVMRFLETADGPVTAGAISAGIGVSTARVAVLLKKLDEKGCITRTADEKDARKTLVCLSPAGKAYVETRRAEFVGLITAVCEKVGPERVRLMMDLQKEVCTAAEEYMAAHPRTEE